MLGGCEGFLRIPEIHVARPGADVEVCIQRVELADATSQRERVVRVALIELETRVQTSNDPVRGILLLSRSESLLCELDIAVIPCHVPTEREQAWIVRHHAQAAIDHLAQLCP